MMRVRLALWLALLSALALVVAVDGGSGWGP
jgi:hypothetical protein